jgi:putative tryptophan/tyrosine transport system substrate-binding protein
MRRRDFITLLGGVAAWPLAARAQQPERIRRIGVLMNLGPDDPEGMARLAAFHQGLGQLGWTVGRNLRIDYRWGAADPVLFRRYATELVALTPDVILAGAGVTVPWLLQATRDVPIVFTQVPDPIGAGYVANLAHPGGNITGFATFDFSIGGKLLGLLKEIAPSVTRAAVLRDMPAANPAAPGSAAQTRGQTRPRCGYRRIVRADAMQTAGSCALPRVEPCAPEPSPPGSRRTLPSRPMREPSFLRWRRSFHRWRRQL